MRKCKCGKEVFTEIHINRRGLSSSVCIDCLEKLIKENKVYWCIFHKAYEYYEDLPIYEAEIEGKEGYICKQARDYSFRECKGCGKLTFDEELYQGYCKECVQEFEIQSDEIECYHSSHDMPKIFHGNPTNGIYFGLEIESEYIEVNPPHITDIASLDTRRLCFFEKDSSLGYGFETITHPMSYEFMRNNNVIEKIISDLKKHMTTTDTCGLHIHVTKTKEVIDKLPQIIMFLENNKEDVIDFCGRISNYAEFYTRKDIKINPYIANEIIFGSKFFGRRRMINLTNKDTIEFRGFKGTLDAKRIYTYIEFILALLETDINENTTFNDLSIPDLLNHA